MDGTEAEADVTMQVVDPHRPEAREAVRGYLAEIVGRIDGISLDVNEAGDLDDYAPPGGRFVLVTGGGTVVGCGAVRTLAPGTGELRRIWIRPDARGTGLGSALIAELIEQSRALGHTKLLLDTHAALTEALAMYGKHGFAPVARYNDNPDATHFLGRAL